MKMLQKFYDHGYDEMSEKLIAMLPNIDDLIWGSWDGRGLSGNRYEPSIPFLFMRNGLDPRNSKLVQVFVQNQVLSDVVTAMGNRMAGIFEGHITKLMLVKVRPEQEPFYHIDPTDTLQLVHRLHMPLVQSTETKYYVGGEEFSMQVGHWYEKNNVLTHAVIDRASPRNFRFSLQCDIYPHNKVRFLKYPNLYPEE
jgi:hypothetical protein